MDTNKHEFRKIIYKELSYKIIESVLKVHNTLGCGFLEKVYENALVIELKMEGIRFKQQEPIKVLYRNQVVGEYVSDILIEEKIILELKTVDEISNIHEAQIINYLKATGVKLGIIINFAKPKLEYKRIVL
jgi:GxxExxY protein